MITFYKDILKLSLEDLKLVFLDRKNCENDGLKKILENKKEFKK